MSNGLESLSPASFDPGAVGLVIAQLKAMPINGGDKAAMLQAWARAVGAQVNSSQLKTVEASGIDNA